MTTLGEAFVPIRATLDKLDQDLAGARGKIQGALGGISKTVGNIGKVALTGVAAGFLAIGGAAAFVGPTLVGLGSDAEEMMGKFNVVFANTGSEVTANLDAFAGAVGRSKFELMGMASTFGDTLKPMGFTEDAAADLSVMLTELAVDLGSFNNMESDEALRRLQGTLIGSHENALAFGVVINENTLKAEMAAQGWDKLTGAELEAAKVQARINLLIAGTTDAQGDAARTAGSWANQSRALKARLTDIGTEVGLKLLPAVTPLLAMFGDMASNILPRLVDAFENKVLPVIMDVSSFFRGFFSELQNGLGPWDAFVEALLNWTQVGEDNFMVILDMVTAIETFIAKAQEVLQPVMDWIAQNVELNDVLIALGILFGAVIIPAIVSLLAPILAVIAVGAALIAAVSLIRQAWETDWGGIRSYLTDAWENTIRPALAALGEWITGTLIPTVQMLYDTWVNVVWPAISAKLQEAWAFIQPILASIGEWITGTLVPTIQELYRVWVEDVWPTIQTVTENVFTVLAEVFEEIGRWINDNIVPWVEFFAEQWREKFEDAQAALEFVWGIIQPIWIAFQEWMKQKLPEALAFLKGAWEGALGALAGPVETIKGIWDGFVDAVQGFWNWISSHTFSFDISLPDLPDWAIPGSPLPIHTAWKGFADEMNRTTVRPSFDLPGLSMAGMGGGGDTGGAGLTIKVDARGATDPAAVERAVARGVKAGLAASGQRADIRIRTG